MPHCNSHNKKRSRRKSRKRSRRASKKRLKKGGSRGARFRLRRKPKYYYDTEIGWNRLDVIKEYRDIYKPNAPRDIVGRNDWINHAESHYHHGVKPDIRILYPDIMQEFKPLYHAKIPDIYIYNRKNYNY